VAPTRFRIDHVVIVVRELARAIADYRALGFGVVAGGEHPDWGTHNAVIPLADDSCLELIAFRESSLPPDRKPRRHERRQQLQTQGHNSVACRGLPWETVGEGLADFALLPDDVETASVGKATEQATEKTPSFPLLCFAVGPLSDTPVVESTHRKQRGAPHSMGTHAFRESVNTAVSGYGESGATEMPLCANSAEASFFTFGVVPSRTKSRSVWSELMERR